MAPTVTFTFDVEDHRSGFDARSRYVGVTYDVLDCLGRLDVRGTFFVVGTVAERFPALVVDIARNGHEIACHGFDHTPLDLDRPEKFANETARAKAHLEDLSGRAVVGYRAPIFSVTPQTTWYARELAALGFAYSASVMPSAVRRYGFAAAPTAPFTWPDGVVELPVPVSDFGRLRLPYLGGAYFRYLPSRLVESRVRQATASGLWTYLHPYDVDAEEGLQRVERTTWVQSFFLSCNRHRTLPKLERLLKQFAGQPLNDRLRIGEFRDAPPLAFDNLY